MWKWRGIPLWIYRGAIAVALLAALIATIPAAGTAAELDDIVVEEIEFKEATVRDAVRIISELTGVNIVATTKAGEGKVTFFVRKLAVSKVVDALCRISGLWYRHNPASGVYVVMTTDEYQRDIVVFRDEPTRMFQLKYLNVGIAARTISDLFGDRVELSGEANWHSGDDYIIEDLDTIGEEDNSSNSKNSKNSKNSSKSNRSGDQSNRSGRSGSKASKNAKQTSGELTDLTPTQIDLLEKMAETQAQRISEALVGQVAKQTAAPIYLTINRLHNMLFVRTADQQAMREIATIIELSDVQVPEVLLEMKVLEVQLNDQFSSAFDISNISGTSQTGPDDGQIVNPLNSSATSVGGSALGLTNAGLFENSTMVFQLLSSNLRVRLQLLQVNQNVKALATPMLLAANNHPARLFIGEETIITTGFTTLESEYSSSGSTTIVNTVPVPETEKKSVGNTLTILPSINSDRSVVMRIIHENSSIIEDGAAIPVLVGGAIQEAFVDTINTAKLEGTFLAQDGMTVAVGGMMRTVSSDVENKVPLLGDIPGLGFFFKEKQKKEIKTELVLLITPHVLSAPADGEPLTRQRLQELTEHPNGIDAYLEDLRQRRKTGGDEKTAASQGTAAAPPAKDDGGAEIVSAMEKNYIDLIRVAAKQVRLPLLARRPEGAVRPTQLAAFGDITIFDAPGTSATPVAAWSNGSQYVTALKVRNLTRERQVLDTGKLLGAWLAATLEAQELTAAGNNLDHTYLYLISQRPFAEALPGGRHE